MDTKGLFLTVKTSKKLIKTPENEDKTRKMRVFYTYMHIKVAFYIEMLYNKKAYV